MAYQSIGLGTSPGDGTGDDIRDGGDKINDNFDEIYTLLGTGTALTSGMSATATVVTLAGPTITGVAAFADGGASTPSITNTGDTNTGMYFSAADTIAFTTGGTQRATIDSTGLNLQSVKITGMSVGTAQADGLTLRQAQAQAFSYIASDTGGSANTYAIAPSPAIAAYVAGQQFHFIAANGSTGASTLNVSSLGTKNIYVQGSAISGASITTAGITSVIYDGTQFQLMNDKLEQIDAGIGLGLAIAIGG